MVSMKDTTGWTPLHVVALHGHVAIVQALLAAGARVNDEALPDYPTLLNHLASYSRCKGDNINPKGRTALYLAVQRRSIDMISVLIAAGADVNIKDYSGWTPLHLTVSANHTVIAHMLIAARADIDEKTNDGRTAMYFAATRISSMIC
jgi:ankyrin repeat protein